MIGIDTSTLVAYFSGEDAADTTLAHKAILDGMAMVAPVVITELLSAPGLNEEQKSIIALFERFSIDEGYWERAGDLRKTLKLNQRKARLGDALIAQACIDNYAPLLTRDTDFRPFSEYCGLKLAKY